MTKICISFGNEPKNFHRGGNCRGGCPRQVDGAFRIEWHELIDHEKKMQHILILTQNPLQGKGVEPQTPLLMITHLKVAPKMQDALKKTSFI